jgi:FlaA1/EpsC-like NDP-sugar epimerase
MRERAARWVATENRGKNKTMWRFRFLKPWTTVSVTPGRTVMVLVADAAATSLALEAALFIRFNGEVPPSLAQALPQILLVLVCARIVAVLASGMHRWSFLMSGIAEAARLAVAVGAGSFLFLSVLHFTLGVNVPRTVVALEFFAALSLMAGFRFAPRLATSWYSEQIRARRTGLQRTVIVGAGSAGDLLLRDLLRAPEHPYKIVGFVDDDPRKAGSWIGGRPVLGSIDELPAVVERLQVSMVMLAIPQLPAERIREILTTCARLKASFKIIPASFAYMNDRLTAAMLHDLSPEDLLPRDEIAFDRSEICRLVDGRRIMVTGGAGSIGAEIATQVTKNGARTVILVDLDENGLYLLARRLRETCPGVEILTEVADIRDAARLRQLGEVHRPQFVFHAAAHKHVPLMEEAPGEAVKNNILGTLNVALMADACGAERLVFISTDKAVKPSSVMGASKRIAELVVRDLAQRSRTKMTSVRFGNVLGSNGSVVPIFKEQIERGGPVTVTHPDCTRYFMTIPEAVGLVLIAGLGGYGELCILDMGKPIRIADMAANLITMAGYIPGEEIEIVYTGLRPGEKLHEELMTEEEEQTQTVRDRICVATSPPPPADLLERLEELGRLASIGDRVGILAAIRKIVPTYTVTNNRAPENQEAESGGDVVPFRKVSGAER